MKKLYAIAVIFVFAGITAFGLHFFSNEDVNQRKSSCATVVSECSGAEATSTVRVAAAEASGCGQAENAVLAAGSEKRACGSDSVKPVTAAAAGCGQAENAVLATGTDKSSCGSDSAKPVTAAAAKTSCCSSAGTQTATAGECSGENEDNRVAENQ
jgi:hypothetical protein